MNITEHEMRGLLAGKCLPGDMRVNEEFPAYLVRKFAEAKAERDALAASFDELAKAVGWSAEQCEQTGESPMDVAVSLVNLVSELENDASTAGQLEELAGAMLNRTLDSGSKQALAYAECADMVAKFAAQLRSGEPS